MMRKVLKYTDLWLKMAAIFLWEDQDLKKLEELWELYEESWDGIFAFLLYTKSDKDLCKYVEENLQDIHNMSGDNVLVFLLDKRDLITRKEGEVSKFVDRLGNEAEKKGIDVPIPFSLKNSNFDHHITTVYTIAEKLDIEMKSIPCLVLFYKFESEEVGVYEILKPHERGYTPEEEQFRNIFGFASECCRNTTNKKEMFDCMKRRVIVQRIGMTVKRALTLILPYAAKAALGAIGGRI